MKPHPDEVDDVKWVSLEEMDAMMDDKGESNRASNAVTSCVFWD